MVPFTDEQRALPPDDQFDLLTPFLLGWLRQQYRWQPDTEDLIGIGLLGAWKALTAGHRKWSPYTLARQGAVWAIQDWQRRGGRRDREVLEDIPFSQLGEIQDRGEEERFTFDERLAVLFDELRTQDIAEAVADRLDRETLVQGLLSLCDPRQRHWIILHYYQHQSLSAIAIRSRVSQSFVQAKVAQAIHRYRLYLEMPPGPRPGKKLGRPYKTTGATHCARGHALTGTALSITKEGRWRCKICWADGARARRARVSVEGVETPGPLWLRHYRYCLERPLDRRVIRAALHAAEQLRREVGIAPLQRLIHDGALLQEVSEEQAIVYLASLGLGYLASLSRGEEE